MELELLLNVFSNPNIAPEEAFENAKTIVTKFEKHLDPKRLDEYVEQIFSKEKGLDTFLHAIISLKDFHLAKERILYLFKFILTAGHSDEGWKDAVLPFAKRIMDVTNLYWKNPREPAKHQQLALDCIISIFEDYSSELDMSELPGLYWELLPETDKTTKFQPSVRGKIWHLLGLVACVTKDTLLAKEDRFNQFYKHIVYTIKKQVESTAAKFEAAILHGSLKAMDKLLKHFTTRIKNDGPEWNQFFQNLAQIIDPKCSIIKDPTREYQLKRREFQRVGLELINNNAKLLNKELFTNYKQWYRDLWAWANSANSSDNNIGKKAIFSYLHSIFEYMDLNAHILDSQQIDEFVSFFVKSFEDVLDSSVPKRHEITVAIQGIGLLAPLCSKSNKVAEITDHILNNIKNIVTELNNSISDKYSGSLSLITVYVDSVSNLLIYTINSDEEDQEANLKFFTQLNLIEQIAIQLLTFYPLFNFTQKKTAHKSFLTLVQNLRAKHSKHSGPFVDRVLKSALTQIIASPTEAELEILIEAMKIKNENEADRKKGYADLGLKGVSSYIPLWINIGNDEDLSTSQYLFDRIIQWSMQSIESLDLSVNIPSDDSLPQEMGAGDLFSSMQPNNAKDFQLFINLAQFLQKLLIRSNSRLLEHWILELTTKIIDQSIKNPFASGFYKLLGAVLKVVGQLRILQTDSKEGKLILSKSHSFMSFILKKVDMFRDDLLVAVLELWLSAPDEILITNVESWSSTLEKIFTMGRVYLELADKSLAALQRWISLKCIHRDVLEEIILKLFPIWQSYFMGKDDRIVPKIANPQRAKNVKNKSDTLGPNEDKEENELMKNVQINILKIVGLFAQIIDFGNHLLAQSLDLGNDLLKLSIPLKDCAPDIYLDSMISQVILLCQNTADRQVRTSACEFFHAVMLYYIGISSRTNMSEQAGGLFSEMFSTVMKLSGDLDYLVRQLFNPLAFQCIHWFSKYKNYYSETILQTVLDNLVSEDGNLKDISADCLSEFFKSALKYDHKKLMCHDVLNRILALSTHANARYRLGASAGFNTIYRDIREDMELCNVYTFALITSFLTSLSLSKNFDTESVIIKSVIISISHLERILLKKKDNFNNKIGKRKKTHWAGEGSICLLDFTKWLLTQTGRLETIYRKECTRLVLTMAPNIRGCGSVETLLQYYMKDTETIISIAEKSKDINLLSSCSNTIVAFLDASSDCYSFLARHDSLKSCFFDNSSKSIFVQSIQEFLLLSSDMIAAELDSIVNICLRLNDVKFTLPEALLHNFHMFLLKVSIIVNSEEQTTNILTILTDSNMISGSAVEQELRQLYTTDHFSVTLNSHHGRLQKFKWLRISSECKLWQKVINHDRSQIDELLSLFWITINNSIFKIKSNDPTSDGNNTENNIKTENELVLADSELQELLTICINLGISHKMIIDASFDPEIFYPIGQAATTKGELFQEHLFLSILCCDSMLKLDELIRSVKIEPLGRYVECLLATLLANKNLKHKYKDVVLNQVIKIWSPISVNCDRFMVARILSGLTALDLQKCQDSFELCSWWCGKDVMGATDLYLQDKIDFIGFLGLFALSKDKHIVQKTMKAVEYVIVNGFPEEVARGDQACMTKFLLQMVGILQRDSSNPKMLELVICIVAKMSTAYGSENNDLTGAFKDVRNRILKISFKLADTEACAFTCRIINTIYLQDECKKTNTALKSCLLPAIRGLKQGALKNFFKRNIVSLMDALSDGAPTTVSKWNLRTMIFNLLSIIPRLCGSKFFQELSDDYIKIQEGRKCEVKKSILKVITEDFVKIKKTIPSNSEGFDTVLTDAIFTANSAEYNALASILVTLENLPNPVKLIQGMLIHEDRVNSNLWIHLVDCVKSIQSQFSVLIQDEKIDNIEEIETDTVNKEEVGAHSNQISKARINLAQSSLAGFSSVLDFTAPVGQESDTMFFQTVFSGNNSFEATGSVPINQVPLSFKCPGVNAKSLEALVVTIRHLSILSANTESIDQEPAWIKYLTDGLQGNHHANVKIFLLAAIFNCQEHAKPWAKFLINRIAKLLFDSQLWEKPMNYFVKDLLIMLLEWNQVAVPEKSIQQEIILEIVNNISIQEQTNRKDLLDHNLKLLSTVIEFWKPPMTNQCSKRLFSLLYESEPNVGIRICKCFLQNGFVPSSNSSNVFYPLRSILKHRHKIMYSEAAENIGLLMKCLKDQNTQLFQEIRAEIKKVLRFEKNDRPLGFVTILRCMQKNWPLAAADFHDDLLELLVTLSFTNVCEIIQIMFSALSLELDAIEEAEEKSNKILNFVSNLDGRNAFDTPCEDAEIGLKILEAMLVYARQEPTIPKLLMKIVTWIAFLQNREIENSNNQQSRYYECISGIYSKFINSDDPIAEKFLKIMMDASTNEDLDVRKAVDQFWSNLLTTYTTRDLILKLIDLTGDQLNPITIILGRLYERCSNTVEFSKFIFDKPLEDCVFENYNLDTSWKTRQSLMPLFAESFSNQLSTIPKPLQMSLLRQRCTSSQIGVNLLKSASVTMKHQFSPTLVLNSSFSNREEGGGFFHLPRFNSEDMMTQDPAAEPEKSPLADLKRHFHVRSENSTEYFAAWQTKQTAAKQKELEDKKNAKKRMRLTRSYRVGEIPDIMIKHSDVLSTMFNLGKTVSEIGRFIITNILTKILKESDSEEEMRKVVITFEQVLQANPSVYSPLVATLMDVSLSAKVLISPTLVTRICLEHHLFELGILMLENHLNCSDECQLPTHNQLKRPRLEITTYKKDPSIFLSLSEIYQNLDDFDVLKNIFMQMSSLYEESSINSMYQEVIEALNFESVGKLEDASANYSYLFHCANHEMDSSFYNFIESAFFKCLTKLTEWEKILDERNLPTTSDNNQVLRIDEYTALSGLVLSSLYSEEERPIMLKDPNEFLDLMEPNSESSEFFVERAALLLYCDIKNGYKSSALLEKFWSLEISSFAKYSSLTPSKRKHRILQCQLASTINDVLKWNKNLTEENIEDRTLELTSRLEKCFGNSSSPLLNAAVTTELKSYFMKMLQHQEFLLENEQIQNSLSTLNFRHNLWVLSLGISDRNITVSNKYLEKSKLLGDEVSAETFLEYRRHYVQYLTVFQDFMPLTEWMPMWSSAWKKIKNGFDRGIDPNNVLEIQAELLYSLISANSKQEDPNNSLSQVNSALSTRESSNVVDSIESGARKLINKWNKIDRDAVITSNSSAHIYKMTESLLEHFPDTFANSTEFLTVMLESLLRTVNTNDNSGNLLFPRLLNLLENNIELHETFSKLWNIIPIYKTLPWLDQIVTLYKCNVEMHTLLEPLIFAIAKSYPDSMQLQYSDLIKGNSVYQKQFVESLKAVVLPTVLHKTSLDEILMNIRKKEFSALQICLIKFKAILQEISNNTEIYGSLHTQFADEIVDALKIHFPSIDEEDYPIPEPGAEGNQFKSLEELKRKLETTIDSHQKYVFRDLTSSSRVLNLKDLCPFLTHFHHSQANGNIKIPGLFDKLSKPNVDAHPNITSFHPTVTVYRTLTYPIRFTMIGNDGKKRDYLAKFGDDLRQDRRIQQLFRVSNQLFEESSHTREQKLNIISYSAIPITESFGIIEWLDKTTKLSSFILHSKELDLAANKARLNFWNFLQTSSGLSGPQRETSVYWASARNVGRQEATLQFDLLASSTPKTLLSHHLLDTSCSFEHFFKTRQNFIRSYAAMCIVHWVIGIGDRHLNNYLMSLETGQLIGIDFGRAFEVTNTGTPIPEIIPFRLTPNFTQMMMPYGCKGMFKEIMSRTLRCLLQSSNTILFIINAFVNEHNLRWKEAGRLYGNEELSSNEIDWKPLHIIKRKLKCHSPISILLQLIESNPLKQLVPIYCDIIKDGRTLPDDSDKIYSHEEIVDTLLDLATDKNILVRLYAGLQTWI